jgi:uncharacterized membrane protein
VQPEVPLSIELLRTALTVFFLLGAWLLAGVFVAWVLFWPNADRRAEPITAQNAARIEGRRAVWLYAAVIVLALLASAAFPMGFAS